jgi:methyltransferase (TIGR00027 family)
MSETPNNVGRMNNAEPVPSQTAMTAAGARAGPLLFGNEPVIFADTLAGALLGDQAEELIGYHRLHGSHLVLAAARGQVTYRSRYVEDCLAAAVAAKPGVAQYVILGAGLDSFGYRSPLAGRVATFEVDQRATQAWKRERLAAAGIAAPGPAVAFVPLDFERQGAESLAEALVTGGFDLSRPALVTWLGVSMYLTTEAIESVLSAVGGWMAAGTEFIADYMLPAGMRDETGDSYVEQVAPFAAAGGEPWLSFLTPSQVASMLTKAGFSRVTHVGQRDVGGPDLWRRNDALAPIELSKLVHAVV